MSSDRSLGLGARCAVVALTALGTVGAAMIVSQGGFATTTKRGDGAVIVQGPEAYAMASIMFCMSIAGVLALCRAAGAPRAYSVMGYAVTCWPPWRFGTG